MSDIPQDGWWLASDGRWYPPEAKPGPAPTQPPGGPTGKRLSRRAKWLIAVAAGVLVLGVIVAGTSSNKPTKLSVASGRPTTTIAAAPGLAAPKPAPTHPPTTPAPTAPPTTRAVTTTVPPPPPTAATPPPTQAPPPTAPPPTQPPATQPPATAVAANLCGAPSNPWGYNFCGRGSVIYDPQPDTCSYFACIANFSNGTGYMEECADGMYSMSGGHRGACSYHGGELRPVDSGP